MDFDSLILSETNTVLAYVVFKEHTLGYLFRSGNSLYLGVLHGKPLLGGKNWKNGNYMICRFEFEHVRKATEKDFDFFNVSSKGYILT